MTGTPTGSPQEGQEPRRYLIATAASHYPKCAQWDRPGLVQAREQVIELFTKKLGYQHVTALGLDPVRVQLTDQLRAFCTSPERREDDLVVVYLSGHGAVLEDGGEHVLLMADTDPADVSYTSLPTADLVRVLRGTRVRRLLLILDTCYSGQGGNELAAAALERLGAQWGQGTTSSGLVIVSSAQPHQQAKTGLFPQLLTEAVSSQATAGHAPAHLSVSAVVQQMNDHPDRPGYQHISLSLLGLTGEPPDFLTNPRHDVRLTDVDLALQDAAEFDAYALRRETEFTTRLLVRAMGYHGDTSLGWWFCGRHRALAELAHWLNHPPDRGGQDSVSHARGTGETVKVVTAGPGSGKTAVLGLIAALALPERRRTVPVDALGLAEDWIPGEGSLDVIMYAQNLTNTEVLGGLAAAAGLKLATVGAFLEALEARSTPRGRPFTVLIDALDEAATPDTLCSQIIRPLIERSQGRIRLLLGTRPYLLESLGIHADDQDRVIDLDSPRHADEEALLAYTMRNLLQSRRTSPYRALDYDHAYLLQNTARAVAEAAGASFLVARFAAYTLASADTVVTDPFDRHWRAGLPRHAGQTMRDGLNRRLGPHAQRAADLLRPWPTPKARACPGKTSGPPSPPPSPAAPTPTPTSCGCAIAPAPTSSKPPNTAAPPTASTTRHSPNTSAKTPTPPPCRPRSSTSSPTASPTGATPHATGPAPTPTPSTTSPTMPPLQVASTRSSKTPSTSSTPFPTASPPPRPRRQRPGTPDRRRLPDLLQPALHRPTASTPQRPRPQRRPRRRHGTT